MKKRALILAAIMGLNSMGLSAAAAEGESAIKESSSGFYYVEAQGEQVRLSSKSAEALIQADGLYFRDLDKDGELDVYEDWRLDDETRVQDLLSKMTDQEKAGTLIFACVFGSNGSTVSDLGGDQDQSHSGVTVKGVPYVDDPETCLYSTDVVVDVNGGNVIPMAYQIKETNVTTFIAALTGNPKDQLDLFNSIQGIAEESRLGIPAVFSGDRSYNTWGGMIDMPHYALGVTHDEELLYDLVSEYSKESAAIGYHQVFHGYGNEIGSFYGDDPNYIAKMAATETNAYQDNGWSAHSKHFIARGGRNAYVNAKSPADLIDSWMVGWKAVVDAGTDYIMTNNNVGVTDGVQGYMDKDTYSILRDDLGYNGVVCLDWPLDISRIMSNTGITSDGVDISTLSAVERYAMILNAGVDMFSCYGSILGTDIDAYAEQVSNRAFPDIIIQAVEEGLVTEEDFNEHVARVLRNKFKLSLFEDPYSDWEDALALIGSEAYQEEQFAVMNNEDINAARRSEITEMEDQVMVESTILLKNENNILPLAAGTKMYVDGSTDMIKEGDTEALAQFGTVVSTMEEADVCIFHVTTFDDNYYFMVEDAQAAGKPIILVFEGTVTSEPGLEQVLSSEALIMQTYVNTPDHGSSVGSFYRYVTPSTTAQMLFGEKEPAGSTLYETAYDSDEYTKSWGELQNDIGVDIETRLYMAMMAKENPTIDMPNNLGDVLWTTDYGISYSNPADIELSLLSVPQMITEVEVQTRRGPSMQKVAVNATQQAGVPFEVSFVAKNNGGDGHMTVQVLDGENVAAEKFVALDGGQFRVITAELTLEAGEHVITVGEESQTIVVE
ncbi:MAG: glycoside hydrolase family 3 N-terminal domain-containing protein [Lachnospiraceae bacterium]|nr:hypothetical protein [Robinsoniella sp.]MDY3767915.1 glycoside hydrolase family 3 N-terminal domain-containing protein [Lachnospiraceae bacterium]